jgi:hypothetical protein
MSINSERAAMVSCVATLPAFAETWSGESTTYPSGRGQRDQHLARIGWQCPGCSRCFGPWTRECPYCPEAKAAQPAVPVMGEWEDET